MSDEQNEFVPDEIGDSGPDETSDERSEETPQQPEALIEGAEETADQGTRDDLADPRPDGRGTRTLARVIFYLVFLVVVGILGNEGVARFTHSQSIESLEQAFRDKPKSGLTLAEARRHVSGLVTMTTRDEHSKMAATGIVRFAVFQWFSVLKDYRLELEIAKSESGEILVKSPPYVPVTMRYETVQPNADGQLLKSGDDPKSSEETKTDPKAQSPGDEGRPQPPAENKTTN